MEDYSHDYAVLYKILSWQSGVRVSLYGFDRVSGHVGEALMVRNCGL